MVVIRREGAPGRAEATALQAFIVRSVERAGLTRYALAKRCGWQRKSVIYRVLSHATSVRTLERLLAALGAKVVIGDEAVVYRLGENGEVIAEYQQPRSRHRKGDANEAVGGAQRGVAPESSRNNRGE